MTDSDRVRLRPAQEEVLAYRGGRMAVSAVPGSGKTFTLSLLAAQLIAEGQIDVAHGQQVLIVTFMNSAVDNFKRRIRERLEKLAVLPAGYDVRTLHSLGLEIVRLATGGDDRLSVGVGNDLLVLDETQSALYLGRAIDRWRQAQPDVWDAFRPDGDARQQNQWHAIVERTAQAFIRTAKNERYRPEAILDRLRPLVDRAATPALDESGIPNPLFIWMFANIYDYYREILLRQGALDFDDLIWQAAEYLEARPDLATALSRRWPFVLEDEAQDSVPLQEVLLNALSAPSGNLVRVGDPNQAITSTFTAAHPRHFLSFLDRDDVLARTLPNSGRSAPLIMDAANAMLAWVIDHHPVPEVAQNTFRRQMILPTPEGDAQPNPPDSEAALRIRVYRNREDEELPRVAQLAVQIAERRPHHTLAVLVPTNDVGHKFSEELDRLSVSYDNLLRGGSRERRIATALHALLAVLADPLSTRAMLNAHDALYDMGHPAAFDPADREEEADLDRPPFRRATFQAVLRSVRTPEALVFPRAEGLDGVLPAGIVNETELERLRRFGTFLRLLFDLRPLPIDDLALALGDELFASGAGDQLDLALAYQIASILRRWRDAEPTWRLPELADQLAEVAAGRRTLPISDPDALGFQPEPGRITLITQHKAKGLEWDAVLLVGVDGRWVPGSMEGYFQGTYDFLGGNPEAQVMAELRQLMGEHDHTYAGRTPTESANIEVICERLRLLYVAVTRARRFLHISRSRATRTATREYPSEPATVLGVLYQLMQNRES